MNNSKLLIIDLSNFIHRAFYGIKPLFNKNGIQTNAVYGVASMIFNLLKHTHPSHVIVALDSKGRNNRNDLFEEYKNNRKEKPQELKDQIPLVLEMIRKMQFCSLEFHGEEADDVIGSLVKREKDNFTNIFIASSDKDLMQLISNNIYMFDSMKNLLYNKERVFEKLGVYPKDVIDYLALVGDKSDNVPGVQGIGPKTASNLINNIGKLETIYDNLNDIKSLKVKEKLINEKDNAFLSKKLVTINCELPLEYTLNQCSPKITLNEELSLFLDELNLVSIKERIMQNEN